MLTTEMVEMVHEKNSKTFHAAKTFAQVNQNFIASSEQEIASLFQLQIPIFK